MKCGRRGRGSGKVRRRLRRASGAAPRVRPAGAGGRGSRLPQGGVRSPSEPRGGRGARRTGPRTQSSAGEGDLRPGRAPRRTPRDGRCARPGARDPHGIPWSLRDRARPVRSGRARRDPRPRRAFLRPARSRRVCGSGGSGRVRRPIRRARSLLQEAANLARKTMQAPSLLKGTSAEADRKRREGEEKLKELEARLAQAKANEHLMNPHQRRRLREYEYQLENARFGFFGGDWLAALLLFEALDNDYMGDPSVLLRRRMGWRGLGRRRLRRGRLGRRRLRWRRLLTLNRNPIRLASRDFTRCNQEKAVSIPATIRLR